MSSKNSHLRRQGSVRYIDHNGNTCKAFGQVLPGNFPGTEESCVSLYRPQDEQTKYIPMRNVVSVTVEGEP